MSGFKSIIKNEKIVFMLIFIAITGIIIQSAVFYIDGDVMWHYKAGEYIVNNGYIPKTDIFSWQQNLNWIAHEWLYDVILYILYSNCGIIAAKILLWIFIIVPIYISVIYNHKKIINQYLFVLINFIIWVFLSKNSFCVRPSEISVIFLMLSSILVVEDVKYKKILFFIYIVLAVNFHGASIASVVILPVLGLIADIISFIVKNDYRNMLSSIKEHLAMALIGFIGSLLNPYGIHIYQYALMISGKLTNYIFELFPMQFKLGGAVILCALILMLGSAKSFREMDKFTVRKYIIMFAFLCLGIKTKRIMFQAANLIILYAYPYIEEFLCNNLGEKVKKTVLSDKLPKYINSLFFIALIFCFIYFFKADFLHNESYVDFALKGNEDDIYKDYRNAVMYIKENNVEGNVFTTFNMSGYYILNDIKVFIDTRCDPYMHPFSDNNSLIDYFNIFDKGMPLYEQWKELDHKYNFKYALIDLGELNIVEVAYGLKKDGKTVLFETEKVILFELD